ncbi:phosphatase [Rothia sp. AR01]|uniref:Phosphatase n=1 Tax=Rothia santali TaxID=2949643 RepID=A0A9X2H897_9MICC|nr:phosphatase [Rothia santali]MCP3424889.1 phosphatase [Rothia santali]
MSTTDIHDEEAFAAYLDEARITGEVGTPRQDNLAHIEKFLAGDEHLEFGVELTREWTRQEVFDLMVDRAGLDPDPRHTHGQDTISAERCVAALTRYARHFGDAVRRGAGILFATGHPAGLFPVYQHLADAARRGGARVIGIEEGIHFDGGDLRQINDVVMYQRYGSLAHTHYPEPMRLVLRQLREAGTPVDFVVADHGWAGAAASAGLPTLGIADCNDPGLFVAEAQGQLLTAVPMDDNVLPHLYDPVTEFVLDRAGLAVRSAV